MAGKGNPSNLNDKEDTEEIALSSQLQELQSRSSGMQRMFQDMTTDQQNSLNELMELKRQRDLLIDQLNRQEQIRAARGHQLAVRKLHSQGEDNDDEDESLEATANGDSGQRSNGATVAAASSKVMPKHEDLVRVDSTLEELKQYIRLGQEMVNTVESGPITSELDQSISLVKEVLDRFTELKSSFTTLREAISEFINARQAKGEKYESVLTFRDELECNFEAAKRCFVSTSKLLQLAVDRRRDWIMSTGNAPSTARPAVLGPSGDASSSTTQLATLKNAGSASNSVTATSQTLWSSLPVSFSRETAGAFSDTADRMTSLPTMDDSASEEGGMSRKVRDREEDRPERDEDTASQVSATGGRMVEHQQQAMMSNLARDLTNWSNELAKLREIYQQSESANNAPGQKEIEERQDDEQDEEEEEEEFDDNQLTDEDRAVIAQAERDRGRLTRLREQRTKEELEIKALLEQRNQLAKKLQQVQQAKAIATAASESLLVGSNEGSQSLGDRMQNMETQTSLLKSLQEHLRLGDMSSPLSFHNDISAPGTHDNAGREDSNGAYRANDDDEEEDSDPDREEDDEDDLSMSLQAAMSGRQTSNMNNSKPLNPDLAMLPELEARVQEMAEKKRELNRLKTLLCMLRSGEQDLEAVNGASTAAASGGTPGTVVCADNANMWRDEDENGPDDGQNGLDQRGQKLRDSVTFQEPVATFIANDELYENMREARMWREQLRDQQQQPQESGRPQVMKHGRGLLPGQNGSVLPSSSMDTASQDRTTLATWGGSSSAGDLDMGTASSNMSDVVREDDQPRHIPSSGASGDRSGSSVSHLESRVEQLQNQLNNVLGMCNTLMVEQSRLSAHLFNQTNNASTVSTNVSGASCSPTLTSSPAPLILHERQSDHNPTDLPGCMAKMAQLQAYMWQVQQQLQMMNNYMSQMQMLPAMTMPQQMQYNLNQHSVPNMFMPQPQIQQPYRYHNGPQFGAATPTQSAAGGNSFYQNEWMMNGFDHQNNNNNNKNSANRRGRRNGGGDPRNESPNFNENGGLGNRHGWGPDSPSID